MTCEHVQFLDALYIEPPLERTDFQPQLDSGAWSAVPATVFHRTGEGHVIRIGNLALHVLDNTIAFVCGWPGPDATGEGVTEALDALLADCHTTQAGVARVWSGAITIEYHTDAPRPVRCDELTVQGGRAVLTPVPTPIPV